MSNLKGSALEPRELSEPPTEQYIFITITGVIALSALTICGCYWYGLENSAHVISITDAPFIY